MIRYTRNQSSIPEVIRHLRTCDDQFHVPLSQRVDVQSYATKMVLNATRYEAWSGNDLIGLVACYEEPEEVYVTNVSVLKEYARRGIAGKLCDESFKLTPSRVRRLEVNRESKSAIAFYKSLGFNMVDSGSENVEMIRESSNSEE